MTLKEYDKFWRYMEYKYCREKDVDATELCKRMIFAKTMIIHYNTGLRCKELLGLRVNEIYPNPVEKDKNSEIMLVKIRKDNSKTGVGRILAAPIRSRVEKIKEMYKKLGIIHKPTDYLFINPSSPQGKQYTREMLSRRLRKVFKDSGLQEQFDTDGRTITAYSARHCWITWRLRYGDVPIALLARAAGTSISLIDKTYAHIAVEKQTKLLTRSQGFNKMQELDLDTNLYNDDEG